MLVCFEDATVTVSQDDGYDIEFSCRKFNIETGSITKIASGSGDRPDRYRVTNKEGTTFYITGNYSSYGN